MTLEKAGRRLS